VGAFLLVADFAGRMRDDDGVKLDHAVRLQTSAGKDVADVVLRVPVTPARLGTVRGQVVDQDGAAASGAMVTVGQEYGDYADRG
jgi:hypothetical protein